MSNYRPALLTVILIALALRLTHLTYHSLWFDEAVSVYWAKQSVPRILEVGFTLVEDRLPPLYYLTLKGWSSLIGFSETGVRALSVLYGVLLVPVTAGLAAMLFNRRVALISAALVAVNPFLIWYSQEARMYAPAVFFSTLAIWAFLKWLRQWLQPSLPTSFITHHLSFLILHSSFFILFVLAAIAGLYHHLYAGFVLPGLGLWLIVAYPRRWQLWLILAASGVIIALAFTPIALAIWRFSAESTPGDALHGTLHRGWGLLQAFILWKAPLPHWLTLLIPGLICLFVLSAYLPTPHPIIHYPLSIIHFPLPTLLITLVCLTPFAIATLLLTRNHLAFFGERYFIVMVPWLLILAAQGADKLGQWGARKAKAEAKAKLQPIIHVSSQPATPPTHPPIHPPTNPPTHLPTTQPANYPTHPPTRQPTTYLYYLIPAFLIILTALPLPGQWTIPASKEAWRQSVDYLAQHARTDHAILIHPDWVRFPFQFYFKGPGQTYAAFSTVTAQTDLDGPLQGVVGDHPVIWLIESHIDAPDPERRVEQWLAARYPLVTELYPPGITLKGYAPGYQLDALPPAATPVDYPFDSGLRLAGYEADADVSATDALFHPPSGWVHVILYWTAQKPVAAQDYPVVRLIGPEGVWGISLDRPGDAFKLYPPSRWFNATASSQKIIRHDLDVNLNPVTPPGVYQLVVELGAEQHSLGPVEVQP
ncbi:MAG: glycosyltransferase family 39 protein [Anaerolineaceae bacterium]|nr:glycosyltransferase family 39 protein [Anaerolineaceae bacterium]MCB9098336.1 glycosyltransferase family 39 protein [Anaerolineales bacterium]